VSRTALGSSLRLLDCAVAEGPCCLTTRRHIQEDSDSNCTQRFPTSGLLRSSSLPTRAVTVHTP